MIPDESIIKRIMPYELEAEQSVIGAMFIDTSKIVVAAEKLKSEDFYIREYGYIFDAIVALYETGDSIDPVSVKDKLRENGAPEEVANIQNLRETIEMVPTSGNIEKYVEIVYQKAVLRKLIRVTEEISNDCYQGHAPLEKILDDAEQKVFKLVGSRNTGDYVPINEVVTNVLKKLETLSSSGKNITGIPTGFQDLDRKISGLNNSDLILIAARPAMGKTALVLNIAQEVAFKQKETVAIFSLEMSSEQLVGRLFSLESRVDAQKFRVADLNDTEWQNIVESAGVIAKSNIIIEDMAGIDMAAMRSKCRKYKLEKNLSLIIIDYLQLMSGNSKTNSREQQISEISRSLKQLARELNVPIIALSQLSRAVEARSDHKPMLSDLRESGAIEQDADIVMFIYRDDYYNEDSEKKGIADIIIAKNRHGSIGNVELAWIPELTKFASLDRRNMDY